MLNGSFQVSHDTTPVGERIKAGPFALGKLPPVTGAPTDPEASYLWRKVDHTAPVGKGMPRTLFGAKRLPEREVELFRRWIETGENP